MRLELVGQRVWKRGERNVAEACLKEMRSDICLLHKITVKKYWKGLECSDNAEFWKKWVDTDSNFEKDELEWRMVIVAENGMREDYCH